MATVLFAALGLFLPARAHLRGVGGVARHAQTPASAHIFVVNLDGREDKWACMADQLEEAPFPVTRSAINGSTLFDSCPNFRSPHLDGPSANSTLALACSNLQIWEQAVKLDSEFVIILEDHTIMSDTVWPVMEKVMAGGCTDWDYILVDPAGGSAHTWIPCDPEHDLNMYVLTDGFEGSHFQIWRTSALPAVIRQFRAQSHANPVDKAVYEMINHGNEDLQSIRANVGFFNVALMPDGWRPHPDQVPVTCTAAGIWRDELEDSADITLTNVVKPRSSASARIFVVNFDSQKEKWACMEEQLQNAPFPVTRFSAIPGDEVLGRCPNFRSPDLNDPGANSTAALTCSNLEIWEQAINLGVEFVIILEDDTILSDAVWVAMEEVLSGGFCADWDYILVDPLNGHPHAWIPCDPERDLNLYVMTDDFEGSYFQIWRTSALPAAVRQLRTHGCATSMDKTVHEIVKNGDSASQGIRATAGFFNVARRAGKWRPHPEKLPEKCLSEAA